MSSADIGVFLTDPDGLIYRGIKATLQRGELVLLSEPIMPHNCPIIEQTGDGVSVGRCWCYMPDGVNCPRHGDVSTEVAHYKESGEYTTENDMRKAKGMPLLG